MIRQHGNVYETLDGRVEVARVAEIFEALHYILCEKKA